MIRLISRAPRWALTITLLAGLAAPAAGAVLQLSSGGARPDESAKMCVSLKDGGNKIAGLQANMTWDDACMTPANAKSPCVADPATGKNVQSAIQGRGELKAILISFTDVNPIPDGPLFCCEFKAVGREGKQCEPVKLKQIIGSTSDGTRIDGINAENNGIFTVLAPGEGVPRVAADETTGTTGAAQTASDDGCTIGARRGDARGAAVVACFALLLALAARLRRAQPGICRRPAPFDGPSAG